MESHSRTGWTPVGPAVLLLRGGGVDMSHGDTFPYSVRVSRSSCALTPPVTRSHVDADASLKYAAGASDEDKNTRTNTVLTLSNNSNY